jgi:hypothetical protein
MGAVSMVTTWFDSATYGAVSGNLGTSMDIFGGALTLTARNKVNSAAPLDPNAVASVGTIYFDSSAVPTTGGLGVQDINAGGSKGISGGGPTQDEELGFTFNNEGAALETIAVLINDWGWGVDNNKDRPVIFVTTFNGISSTTYTFDAPAVHAASDAYGTGTNSWWVDFNDFAGVVGGSAEMVTSFAVREAGDHIYVKGVTIGLDDGVIPEPSAMLLVTLSGLGLALRRRR